MNRSKTLPAAVSAFVERNAGSVLLECASSDRDDGWTQLFTSPLRILSAHAPSELSQLFAELAEATAKGRVAAGFLAYEAGNCFEPRAGLRPLPAGEPLAWFGVYERSYSFDRSTGFFKDAAPPGLAHFSEVPDEEVPDQETPTVQTRLAVGAEEYVGTIDRIHEWIRSGDVYQLNYTLPLEVSGNASPAALYRELIRRQPVAYAAYVHWQPGRHILSLSPELFFRMEDRDGDQDGARRILTRPMKGTAPRGRTTAEDVAQAAWLKGDEKNRAENLMIVDLLRNDLGRIAETGSVRVEDLFAVERHPTLWQMTSTISARLRSGASLEQVFRALFPCGSITGAPKLRAMQILSKLEGRTRGVYTGSIGFVSPVRAEFNVAIRTLELNAEQANGKPGVKGRMGIGSGVVIDSEPRAEYAECLLKARFLTHPAPEFQLIESLLWKAAYPRLPLHLDRLADSAAYFDFAFNRDEIEAALQEHAGGFDDSAARKVRLLVDHNGALAIYSERLAEPDRETAPVRVRIAAERIDTGDPFYFHKTTHRPLYARAFAEAQRDGFGEVLFFNQRGELTEGAISNVFVEKNGRWFTPPIACGVLAGVERGYLLATQSQCEERVLTEADLRSADAVWLTNAVRGVRKTTVV